MENKQLNQYYESIEEQEIKLSDYIRIISTFKWLVIFVFLAVFAATVIYTARSPRIYKATSKVLLQEKMTNNLLFTGFNNTASSINNNIQILKSYPVLQLTFQLLKRDNDFDSFPINQIEGSPAGYIRENLSVDTERETDIMIINFESTNSVEAKAIANAAARALMQQDTDYARIEFRSTREFLAEQLEDNERQLMAAEEELRNFKLDNNISLLTQETEQLIEQSAELSALLSAAETERDVSRKHVNYLQNELSQQDTFLLDVNSVLTSPLLEQLKTEIVANQTQYVNLLTRLEYSPDHPELLALNKAIESAKKRLNDEIQRISSVNTGSSDPLQYRASLIDKISAAKIELNINEAKVASLLKAVEAYNQKMSLLPDTEIELARLERSYRISEKTYIMLIEKYEEAKIVEQSKVGSIRLVEEALAPENPIKPNIKMNLLIGIVLGLGLGIGLALLLHSLDSKIRNFDDVKRYVGLPVLGTIPLIQTSDSDFDDVEKMMKTAKGEEKKELELTLQQMDSKIISNYAPKSSAAESFRILRTNLVAKKKEDESMSILITSSGPKEGKTTIHTNLATTLSQMDAKVILVDLDLRRPRVHSMFHIPKEDGISDFLVDKTTKLEPFIKKSSVPNLDVITIGYIPPNPSELLASSRMDEAIKILKTKYDFILFDAPPVIAVTDAMILAKKIDYLYLVVRVSQADKLVIKRAKELLENIDVDITGAVINGIIPQSYYSSSEYHYYYYYYYGKEQKKKRLSSILRKNKPVS
ncbi:MAG: polysaccharide biosynthesis tyrosine autokinase [Candidatus Cloacimonetes bacterium]|nr:polysaccharide biosynthesis tyrosine autokinase [Candidatus Cloacimonadota bacterium]MCF7813245.1 polysaccharide biosynthesis tyrosine autokinase [Candidatus Cloacimonadota bacterium]MCF7867444.1 polysaccharide biosynthesis tyrosine autokinase [Candidatus Cloacimonadota bacterium]MCF7882924.1 polysaccharide biosynthesis tyrosine autokinase [Candidatus Cloacimonadota bacterium]